MQGNAAGKLNRPAIVLFRNDLRLADNKALSAAASSGMPVLCVLIFDEVSSGVRPPGAASRWWLHQSIQHLRGRLRKLGADLVLRRGEMAETVLDLQAETLACGVYWNRRYEPAAAAADARLKTALRQRGVTAESFDGQLMHEPTLVKTGSGGPYKVFGAFRRALEAAPEPRDPVDAPDKLDSWEGGVASDRLEDWGLLPTRPDWAGGLREVWTPGEDGSQDRLDDFLDSSLVAYAEGRDFPDKEVTSRLSPHLSHGEITPFQILARLRSIQREARSEDIAKLRSEIMWREFCYHLLFHFPALAEQNYNAGFDRFIWQAETDLLKAWQTGATGYPIVDAGMRQLWQTGWMHNRVRMIAASFLSKHLLIDWRIGEKWFWNTLVDADVASNPANWQWVAGSGADAAPYFRIFNPVLQGEKFDRGGGYTRRFVPELSNLADKFLHKPWHASRDDLERAGVKLGGTYPVPLIDHDMARNRALAAYKRMKGNS